MIATDGAILERANTLQEVAQAIDSLTHPYAEQLVRDIVKGLLADLADAHKSLFLATAAMQSDRGDTVERMVEANDRVRLIYDALTDCAYVLDAAADISGSEHHSKSEMLRMLADFIEDDRD